MCDITSLECAVEGCSNIIPIHISNFALSRDVIHKAFCSEHKPNNPTHNYIDYFTVGKWKREYTFQINIRAFRRNTKNMTSHDILTILTGVPLTPNTTQPHHAWFRADKRPHWKIMKELEQMKAQKGGDSK